MQVDINKVIEVIIADAENKRLGAGMDGRWDDGGARTLQTQIEYYRYGMSGTIPPDWMKYVEEAKAKADPEYETYKRLKAKFRDR